MNAVNIMEKAQMGKYAVGQFNVSTDEQLKAIIEVAKNLKSPVIIGTSEGERKFIGANQAVALVKTWQKQANLPIILNADHCKTFESAKEAIDAGYSGIHFDGSALSFEENVKTTKQVVKYAKIKNPDILVEGEMGYLRGSSEIHKKVEIKEEDLTKPEQAKEFAEKTGVDSLAIAIGNVHGVEINTENPHLYLNKLEKIQKAVPNTFLVLHGGSGTPEKDIKKAIKLGVVKININTELRVAYSKTLKKFLEKNPEEIKPYKILASTMWSVKEVVEKKIKLFNSQEKI